MGKTNGLFGWALSAALCLASAGPGTACAFHGYSPNPTLIDVLLATEQAVIARAPRGGAGHYITVETLAGPDVPEIPLRVAPTTRALLAGRPTATVLLARDGAYGPWLEIAVLDESYRTLLTRVMRQQSDLLLDGDKKRLRLFATLLNDRNPDIRRLALQELDRAPYWDIKAQHLPPVQNLRQDLESGDADLTPIRILLAGLSGDRAYTGYLSAQLDRAIAQDLPYLGAYATALIELEGQAAVRDILARAKAEGLSITTRERLLQALAIQYKTAPSATRRDITRGVTDLVRHAPELAEVAMRQFGFQSRRSLAQSGPQR